jgi:hypothetical protein
MNESKVPKAEDRTSKIESGNVIMANLCMACGGAYWPMLAIK